MSVTALVYCLGCDGPLIMRTTGPGTRFEKRAILDCTACGAEHVVTVHVDITEPTKVARCDTTGGYAAHLRRGETPCAACKQAHNRYLAATRASRKKVRA